VVISAGPFQFNVALFEEAATVGYGGEGIGGSETEDFGAEGDDSTNHRTVDIASLERQGEKHDGKKYPLKTYEICQTGFTLVLVDSDDTVEIVKQRSLSLLEDRGEKSELSGVAGRQGCDLAACADKGCHLGVDGVWPVEVELMEERGRIGEA
jgi:hypothetical protein